MADLSALYKLLVRTDGRELKIGGKGVGELCFLCHCLRGCTYNNQVGDEHRSTPCDDCKVLCKITIGSVEFSVLRDNLECKLGLSIAKLIICILHREL